MRVYAFILAGFFALLGDGTALHAQTVASLGPDIAVRAGTHPGFDRIVFDWPRDIRYKLAVTEGKATLTFAANARPHFNTGMFAYLTRASGFTSTTDADGHLIVSFATAPNAKVRDFTSDHSVAVDIEGGTAPRQPVILPYTVSATPPPAPVPVPVQKTEIPAADTPKPAPPSQVSTPETAGLVQLVAKAAPVPPAASVAAPLTPAPPNVVAALPGATEVLPVKDSSIVKTTVAAKEEPPVSGDATVTTPATAALPTLPPIGDTPTLIVSFDPHIAIGSVIFQRAGYGYVVFSRKLSIDAATLVAGLPPPLVTLEPVDLPKVNGFRFVLPADVTLHATRQDTVWQIYAEHKQPEIPVTNNLIAQPDFALGGRYVLPLSESPEPVRLTDPVVGDNLILVPLSHNEAFSVSRRMGDFKILPAAQGLVIRPLVEKLVVRPVSDGIEITSDGGLHMSSDGDTGAAAESLQKLKAAASGKSIFAFNSWRGRPGEDFTHTRQRLQQTIVDVPDGERDRARFELARFYFAQGYGEEAISLFEWLARAMPDMLAHPDYLALLGASHVVAFRPEKALAYLQNPGLDNQPEIDLWRGLAHAELRDWPSAKTELLPNAALLDAYPEPLYSRFMILAVETALANASDRTAATLLDKVEGHSHTVAIDPAILYLRGVMYAKAGRASDAKQAWTDVVASRDRLYKIRAELALVDLGISTKSLTPLQAADRLEALRFGWRGDDLEIEILHRLGEFYVQAGDVRSGINVFGEAVKLYPNSVLAPEIRNQMQKVFQSVFLGEVGKNMSPLDSLTLYQQYHNMMPGGKDGITVIRNLAERLVSIDLLEQAAALLDDLVKNHLQGEEKARTGTRLAAIRLLDHKPADALAALAYSDDKGLPPDLQTERALLRARALSEQHKDDEALALLQTYTDRNAKLLRTDILMHGQRWQEAARALLDLVGPPPKAGESLSREQAGWVVNAAMAYSLAGDQTGIDKLAIDYGAAMAATPQNGTFRVLTEPEKSAQLLDITAAQGKLSEVDLFQGFLNNYRKSGTDAAPDAKPAVTDAAPAPTAKK